MLGLKEGRREGRKSGEFCTGYVGKLGDKVTLAKDHVLGVGALTNDMIGFLEGEKNGTAGS